MLLKEKKEIEAWLNQHKIVNYTLIENKEYGYVVNVNDNVLLFKKKLKNIPVKFNEINGWFDCSSNELTSLEGSPEIVNDSFFSNHNQLKSIKYCPKIIKKSCYFHHNKLILNS